MQDSEFSKRSVGAAVAAWMGFFVGPNAVLSSTQGLFLVPLSQAFGLSRGMISAIVLLTPLIVTLGLPWVGRAIDRWGLRRVLLPGLILFGVLHIILGYVQSIVQLAIVMGLLSIAATMHSSVGYAKVVSLWFSVHRGLVLGCAVALGSGLGSALLPQLIFLLIRSDGWRVAYRDLGGLILLLGVPVMLGLLREPQRDDVANRTGQSQLSGEGLTLREALQRRAFWLIYVAMLLTFTALLGTLVHGYAMWTERGFAPRVATNAISFMFIGSIAGQLVAGVVVDRFNSPRVTLPFFVSAMIGIAMLHSVQQPSLLLMGAVAAGLALGAENAICAYLTSRYFGMRAFGSIFGCTFSANNLAVVCGVYAMGRTYDVYGSYQPMRWVFVGFCAMGVLCMALLGPYVYPAGRTPRESTEAVRHATAQAVRNQEAPHSG